MLPVFDDVACVALPLEALQLLAPLRCEPGVQLARHAGRLWMRFEAGSEIVLRTVLPLHGVELFSVRAGTWRRFGQSLPAFDFPGNLRFESLVHALVPAPVVPLPPGAAPVVSLRLGLRPDDRPRPTTAMLISVSSLVTWAETVSSYRLDRLHAMMQGDRVLIVGEALPVLEGGVRLWGKLVLTPLGWCADPELPEADLRDAAGVAVEELLLLLYDGVVAAPRTALARLSRAALRLAAEARP